MLSRNYHILELGEGLFASSGLETAIRINPDPLCANFLQHRFGNNLHLLRGGHPRTVHIKDPQTNGTAIGPGMQAFGQFSSLFGVLDGDDIRIESIDQRSEGLGRCGLPRSVKVRRADNDGQTTEEACPDVGKSAGFQRLGTGCWLLRLPAAHATRDIPLPKTAVGATLVPTVGNARNVG